MYFSLSIYLRRVKRSHAESHIPHIFYKCVHLLDILLRQQNLIVTSCQVYTHIESTIKLCFLKNDN